MLATITLAVRLFSQILANSQLTHLKFQKLKTILLNSHILAIKNTACEHRSSRRKVIICGKQAQVNETARSFIFSLQSAHYLNVIEQKAPSG